MSAETLPTYGPVELTGVLFDDLPVGILGRIESVRFIESPPSVAAKVGFKAPTYGKAQWKSEVNRHRKHK